MGKRVVDDATLSALAKELRAASRQSGELVFPDDFIASAHSAHAEGYTEGRESGYKDGMSDFANNRYLGNYYDDSITSLAMYAFAGRSSLDSVTLPEVRWISNHGFYYCQNLKRVCLPLYGAEYSNAEVTHNMFNNCYKLEFVELGFANKIASSVFNNCKALHTIILRRPHIVELYDVSVFNGSSFAQGGTGGIIYVPAALIEEYKTATNWSALYAYGTVEFVALEGSEYENADY